MHDIGFMKAEQLSFEMQAGATKLPNNGEVGGATAQLIHDRFRCGEDVANIVVDPNLSHDSGYFRFGSAAICYGQYSAGPPATRVTDSLHDAREAVAMNGYSVQVPFDPVQVVDNLRLERYDAGRAGAKTLTSKSAVRDLYYLVRPALSISARKHLQRLYFRGWDRISFPKWPVDRTVEEVFEELLVLSMKSCGVRRLPFIWFWPAGARSCTIMTHDVETVVGRDHCSRLMDLDDSFGIKSSFQIVPEKRYSTSETLLQEIRQRGCEINVHDLNHDGRLMCNREEFLRRVERINRYVRQFDARGFRSAVMYRSLNWYDALDVSYDMSMPNVAHLDPQQGGCCTVFPFSIGNILELPVTTTQDYSLFHILRDYSIELWKRQISLIRQKHGLISFLIHPDYIIHETARCIYVELLEYLCDLRAQNETWIALPREVAAWWKARSELNLVKQGSAWRVEGEGSERARLAFAVLANDKVTYEFDK